MNDEKFNKLKEFFIHNNDFFLNIDLIFKGSNINLFSGINTIVTGFYCNPC